MLGSSKLVSRLASSHCRLRKIVYVNVTYKSNHASLHEEASVRYCSADPSSKAKRGMLLIAGGAALTIGGLWWKYRKNVSQSLLLHAAAESASEPSVQVFTEAEVSQHRSKATGVWVTFNGKVYDVSDFVDNHPGGDKIMLAAGGPLEPFWNLYAVHKSPETFDILSKFEIGELKVESTTGSPVPTVNSSDPYANEPKRHPALIPVSQTPFNAETPRELLIDTPVTHNDLFFVRNHLPVPQVDMSNYKMHVDGLGINRAASFTLEQLKSQFPRHTVRATVMCTGNRRADMSQHREVRGLAWGVGAISTADWSGVRLADVLRAAGFDMARAQQMGIRHVQFEGLDKDAAGETYGASVPAERILDPNSDVLVAYEMNGQPLSADHGYPLRVIIPGVVGARHVKWLHKIVLSSKESASFWQQKDYKTFSPSADFSTLDYTKSPAIVEPPVQSAICYPRQGQIVANDGSITVKGYAWSGGGRGIIRVEVSADGGETWHLAELSPANRPAGAGWPAEQEASAQDDVDAINHRGSRQWAWTLWEVDVPIPENMKSGTVELLCKAVDSAQNVQPESYRGTWNIRGLLANAWHHVTVTVADE